MRPPVGTFRFASDQRRLDCACARTGRSRLVLRESEMPNQEIVSPLPIAPSERLVLSIESVLGDAGPSGICSWSFVSE